MWSRRMVRLELKVRDETYFILLRLYDVMKQIVLTQLLTTICDVPSKKGICAKVILGTNAASRSLEQVLSNVSA